MVTYWKKYLNIALPSPSQTVSPLSPFSLLCSRCSSNPSILMSYVTRSLHIFLTPGLYVSPSSLQSPTCLHPVTIIRPVYVTKPSPSASLLHLLLCSTTETLCIQSHCLNFTQGILSFNVTPHIYLTIILSTLSGLCSSSTFISQVSLAYIIELHTHTHYILLFNLRDACPAISIEESSLNFFSTHETLAHDASPAPSAQLSISQNSKTLQLNQLRNHIHMTIYPFQLQIQ
jgi:hypothetical protein